MLNFDQVIRTIGPQAYELQQLDVTGDAKALNAVSSRNDIARSQSIINWLRYYAVWRGLNSAERNMIAQAALAWCDSQPATSSRADLEYLVRAHEELARACRAAVNGKRQFESLASKVLWLRYPYDTPIFDGNAQRALWVLSKCQSRVLLVPPKATTYGQFTAVWNQFYSRHRGAIESIDIGDYPYRVRIFDRILWMLGAPRYTLPI